MERADGDLRTVVLGAEPTGLARVFGLDDHLDVVARAYSVEGATDALAADAVSVVAVDMALPNSVASQAIRELVAVTPPVGVVALTAAPLDEVSVGRALGAGAHACVTPRTVAEHGSAPFAAAAERRTFLPAGELGEMIVAEGHGDDLTSIQRSRLLRNMVIGLIPLAGILAALVSLLWRRYLGQIGVRPVDLAVDPASRLADVFFTISVLVGLIGPQVFVGSWLDLIIDRVSERPAAWLKRHRTPARLALAVLTLAATIAVAQFSQLLFALFAGPFVGALLLAKMFDLDDDLPAVMRLTRTRPRRAMVGAALVFAFFLALLSYEVVVRGPEFDERGAVGWIAPDVLGFNAQPVQVTAVDDGGVSEMLYLGGNADLYVLVDPCDGDRVDYVSVGATRLTVIDRLHCE
jgi:hypothetical protein